MQAPQHFSITITGSKADTLTRSNITRGELGRFMEMLLTGQPLPDSIFKGWGITVSIEETEDRRPPKGYLSP